MISSLNSNPFNYPRNLQYYNISVIYPTSKVAEIRGKMSSTDKEALAKEFINSLDQSVKVLIILRDELYDGSWDLMVKDLQSRLKGEPYIYKLASQIDADMQSITKIRAFEEKHSLNMGKFINLSTEGLAQ